MWCQCLGGGIGRRAGFKIQCLRTCGFDSHPRYLRALITDLLSGFCHFVSDGFEIKNAKITTLKLQDFSRFMDKLSHKFSKGPNRITS